jgi:hypothetical protein
VMKPNNTTKMVRMVQLISAIAIFPSAYFFSVAK